MGFRINFQDDDNLNIDVNSVGPKGDPGRGIVSITKTSTSGLVDTYTILYTDDNSETFIVTNGNGITNITLNNDYTLTITTNTGSYTTSESIRGETGNGISDISKTGTSGNVDTYTITFTDGNSTTFEVTNGSVTSVNGRTGAVTGLAENDGYFQQMTVGNADQLVSTVFIEDKTPYIFRTSGGSADIGDREYDEIVGGTIAWNQHWSYADIPSDSNIYSSASYTANNVTFTKNSDGSISIQTTAEGASADISVKIADVAANGGNIGNVVRKHTLLICGVVGGSPSTYCINYASTRNTYASGAIFSPLTSGFNMWLKVFSGAIITTPVKVYPNIIDLTQMFGSTIADYIYTLETATPGAGVAWFRKLFPKDYYPYNAGTLLSVNASAHKMVGFNQLDESRIDALGITKTGDYWEATVSRWVNSTTGTNKPGWDGIHYIPGVTYCASAYVELGSSGTTNAKLRFAYKDGTETTGTQVVLAGAKGIIKVVSNPAKEIDHVAITYGSGTSATLKVYWLNVNLHWDGERDGEYEPYEVHNYPLDSSLTLRGIPKLDAGNNLYYDGDTYEADGTVTRRYGIVDLGTLSWHKRIDTRIDVGYYFDTQLPNKKASNANVKTVPYIVFPEFGLTAVIAAHGVSIDKAIWTTTNNTFFVCDSAYSDETTFKAAMNGVYVVYELETPTTESADPFSNPQIVNDFGTEEYVVTEQSGVAVPVGHNTKYANNLRAKLEMAPDSPPGDGDYIVRQTDGENEYVPLASSSIITGIQSKLPSAPSIDGSYLLNATVNGSTNTYAWSQGSVSELESDIARNTFYILDLYNKINEVPSTATYNEIASVVQNGDAPRLFKTGSQITANYNDGTNSYILPWDIVACRDIVDANGVTKPGMIIQSHYAMQECQFDQNEGFFVVPAGGLSANTFHFTMGNAWGSNVVKDKVYQFTTTEDYAEGDIWQLGKATSEISGLPDTSPSDWRVRTYKAANGVSAGAVATATEILTLSEGSGGTDLGTLSSSTKYGASGLNNMQRAAYGYNRWGQSGIRQWLNSSAVAGAWWTSQNPYDRAPSQLSSMRGFMAGFDNDFLSIIKPVTITTALNTVTDTDIGASETTVDTFFLPSLEEEYIVPQVSGVEGAYWPYWKDRLGLNSPQGTGSSYANTNHIGYRYDSKTSAVTCRLRSAYRSYANYGWYVNSSGYAYYYSATYSNRMRPACVIY